ncbi:hypothetical protein CEUSTIGMA_g2659.t1 [Chlamydomonas eustigma]|uniref:Uncharacterized protein n=1 Tax=Chlamydomonas eustigma TaxID=1157962 RepID=A0A250WWP2_9CHLO|nr:hypothetical protein CEUSTIGMA_g2659.t1 [Chlamydomonas eustigma]|eukprot:GAX75215.1 hypothetical protein CEUSTIGMA_g2659.t1 [Chlamydomonas eustigma]
MSGPIRPWPRINRRITSITKLPRSTQVRCSHSKLCYLKLFARASGGTGSGSNDGKGRGGSPRGRRRRVDLQSEKWLKFESLSSINQPAARAVDAARNVQTRFNKAMDEYMNERLDNTTQLGKVMLQYSKGFMELQHTYCEVKTRIALGLDPHGSLILRAISSDPRDQGSSSSSMAGQPATALSMSPSDMVLPDIQHLLLLGLMPTAASKHSDSSSALKSVPSETMSNMQQDSSHPQSAPDRAGSSKHTTSSSSSSSPSSTRSQEHKEAVGKHSLLTNHLLQLISSPRLNLTQGSNLNSNSPTSNLPPAFLPSRPVAPLFEPLCAKAADVTNTLRATSALQDHPSTRQLLQTGMYWLLRHAQHVPIRHGVTMDSCEPDDFLVALVVALAGAATSTFLSAVDFKKKSTVKACCEVLHDISKGLSLLSSPLAIAQHIHTLSQLLALQQHVTAVLPGQASSVASQLHALMTSSPGSSALLDHPLIAFDAWHRLGDHFSLRSLSTGRAEPAYAAALAAFSNLDDGCCDGYHDIGAKLDHRTFVSYWADLALISNYGDYASSRKTATISKTTLHPLTSTADKPVNSSNIEGTAGSGTELPVSGSEGGTIVSSTEAKSSFSPLLSTSNSDAATSSVKGDDKKTSDASQAPDLEPSGSVEKMWASYVPGAVFFHRDRIRCFHSLVRVACAPQSPSSSLSSSSAAAAAAAVGRPGSRSNRSSVSLVESVILQALLPVAVAPKPNPHEGTRISNAGIRQPDSSPPPEGSTTGSLPSPSASPASSALVRSAPSPSGLRSAALNVLQSSRLIHEMCIQQSKVQGSIWASRARSQAAASSTTSSAVASATVATSSLHSPTKIGSSPLVVDKDKGTAEVQSSAGASASLTSESTADRDSRALDANILPISSSHAVSDYISVTAASPASPRPAAAAAAAPSTSSSSAVSVMGLAMAEACMHVGGLSVLSPKLRSVYSGWFVKQEEQAVHDFTRRFADAQRSLVALLAPNTCMKLNERGLPAPIAWSTLSKAASHLLDMWQCRPGTLIPTPYQQSWLLLATVLVNPDGPPLLGLNGTASHTSSHLSLLTPQQQEDRSALVNPTDSAESSSSDDEQHTAEVSTTASNSLSERPVFSNEDKKESDQKSDQTPGLPSGTRRSDGDIGFDDKGYILLEAGHFSQEVPRTSTPEPGCSDQVSGDNSVFSSAEDDVQTLIAPQPSITGLQYKRFVLPRLQSLYDRPGILFSAKGVPIDLNKMPTLQHWFGLTVHNIAGAANLMSTPVATMDRSQPIATVVTLALQRRLVAAGKAAAAAISAAPTFNAPRLRPRRITPPENAGSSTGSSTTSPHSAPPGSVPAPLPAPGPSSASGSLPSKTSEDTSTKMQGEEDRDVLEGKALAAGNVGRSVLFALRAATKVPLAPEYKAALVSLLSQYPEHSSAAAEALLDMAQRTVYRPPSSAACSLSAAAAAAAASPLSSQNADPSVTAEIVNVSLEGGPSLTTTAAPARFDEQQVYRASLLAASAPPLPSATGASALTHDQHPGLKEAESNVLEPPQLKTTACRDNDHIQPLEGSLTLHLDGSITPSKSASKGHDLRHSLVPSESNHHSSESQVSSSEGVTSSSTETASSSTETAFSSTETPSSSTETGITSSGKRAARRLRKVLLKGSGMPELARPSLVQVVEATKTLVQTEMRRRQSHRGAKALCSVLPLLASTSSMLQNPSGLQGCVNDVSAMPGPVNQAVSQPIARKQTARRHAALDLPEWGVKRLLKPGHPYLALEIIRTCLECGCCSLQLISPFVHYCVLNGSDHALEVLLAYLPSTRLSTSATTSATTTVEHHPAEEASSAASKGRPSQDTKDVSTASTEAAGGCHPLTSAVLGLILDLVLDLSSGKSGNITPSFVTSTASAALAAAIKEQQASTGAAAAAAAVPSHASQQLSWLCPLLGQAMSRSCYVPTDDACKKLLLCLLREGCLDLALASVTQGFPPVAATSTVAVRIFKAEELNEGSESSCAASGESWMLSDQGHSTPSESLKPLGRLLVCCGSEMQSRLLLLAATTELPKETWLFMQHISTGVLLGSSGSTAALGALGLAYRQQLAASLVHVIAAADFQAVREAAEGATAAWPASAAASSSNNPETDAEPSSPQVQDTKTSAEVGVVEESVGESMTRTSEGSKQESMMKYLLAEGFTQAEAASVVLRLRRTGSPTAPATAYSEESGGVSTSYHALKAATAAPAGVNNPLSLAAQYPTGPHAASQDTYAVAVPAPGPNLAASAELLDAALVNLSRVPLVPSEGMPALLLSLYDFGARHHGLVLRLDSPEGRTLAAKLLLSMAICGRYSDAHLMMRAMAGQAPCLDALLHVVLRDKLVNEPALNDHLLRWACQLAVQAARNQNFDSSHAMHMSAVQEACLMKTPASSGGDAGSSGVTLVATHTATEDEEEDSGLCFRSRHWQHRNLLVKSMIVGQKARDPGVLQQVTNQIVGQKARDPGVLQQIYEEMTMEEVLEAAAIVAQNGRPDHCLPLLKHVSVRFGLRAAADSAELPLLINALAGNRRLRSEHKQVPPGCKQHIALLLVAATRNRGYQDLGQLLSAPGKRLAMEVCYSQGHFITAVHLWLAWQARHSAADVGLAATCMLLIACAEVGDFTAGESLLGLLRPSQLLPQPSPTAGLTSEGHLTTTSSHHPSGISSSAPSLSSTTAAWSDDLYPANGMTREVASVTQEAAAGEAAAATGPLQGRALLAYLRVLAATMFKYARRPPLPRKTSSATPLMTLMTRPSTLEGSYVNKQLGANTAGDLSASSDITVRKHVTTTGIRTEAISSASGSSGSLTADPAPGVSRTTSLVSSVSSVEELHALVIRAHKDGILKGHVLEDAMRAVLKLWPDGSRSSVPEPSATASSLNTGAPALRRPGRPSGTTGRSGESEARKQLERAIVTLLFLESRVKAECEALVHTTSPPALVHTTSPPVPADAGTRRGFPLPSEPTTAAASHSQRVQLLGGFITQGRMLMKECLEGGKLDASFVDGLGQGIRSSRSNPAYKKTLRVNKPRNLETRKVSTEGCVSDSACGNVLSRENVLLHKSTTGSSAVASTAVQADGEGAQTCSQEGVVAGRMSEGTAAEDVIVRSGKVSFLRADRHNRKKFM